jgi:eukaryotic-like serine/threonine-protein kinase
MVAHAMSTDGGEQGPPEGASSEGPSSEDPTRTGAPVSSVGSGDVAGTPAIPKRSPERYQIIEEHGRGGLGRVSRARDRDLGRDIAIKEMLTGGHLNEVRFLREALITARLQHPGIVPIYEAGRWPDGTPFYAMKLVAGRPLRELIVERTTVEQRLGLLHHVIAVADAIAYAHGRRIIHRDLKPANVIVGDFGETVVIDWGIAKDLSADEEPSLGGGPYRSSDSGLTEAGDVLGTPTYMAPEQERGEYVDQRADVYAIGAMLWDLCSLHKLPSVDARQRRRLLRRARIDRDLATIVDKALEPDPDRRYPDAGALAADLKAFTSGARIAARRYSLFAMLGHWMRRHRALAVTIGVALALAVAGAVFYVRSITAERDRVAASNNRLILKHAELLLQGDPTAAFDLLETYSGGDATAVAMLRAKARGLGVATRKARPHTLAVYFAHALADGSLITLSGDGTVARTAVDGTSRMVARGFAAPYAFNYAESSHLLAYSCDGSAICLLDILTEAARPAPPGSFTPASLAFSPSGNRLAALSAGGETSVWELGGARASEPSTQPAVRGAKSIRFVDEPTLAVHSADRVTLIHLDGRPQAVAEIAVRGGNQIDASAQRQLVAAGTADGAMLVIDSRTNGVVRRETVCPGAVNKVLVVPGRRAIAYACQNGDAGTWDHERDKLAVLAHIDGGATNLAGSADGRYLLVGGSTGKLMVHDATTQMVRSYLGHTSRLTALVPPSPASPYLLSGDTTGAVRAWTPPDATVSVAITTAASMYRAVLLPGGGPLIALGAAATIPWHARDGSSGALDGHDPSRFLIAVSPVQPQFALYGDGDSDEIELWSFAPEASRRIVKTDRGPISAATFTDDGTQLVVGNQDGQITTWSLGAGQGRELGSIREPVEGIRPVPGTDSLVIAGAKGALWLGTANGITHLATETARISSLACSRDGRWVAIGTAAGIVRLHDLRARTSEVIIQGPSGIGFLAFSRDSQSLAVSTARQFILRAVATTPLDAAAGNAGARWKPIEMSSKYVAFSPDNRWLALTGDRGEIWFYRRSDEHWVHLSVGTARVQNGMFSEDGATFVATDASGRALLVDMRAHMFD